jgi:hypothetical protein
LRIAPDFSCNIHAACQNNTMNIRVARIANSAHGK